MVNEEIVKKYSISDEEKKQVGIIAENMLINNKTPVENPVCVIVGGQTGSGKSGLIAYSTKMFPDGNVIVLEDDSLRYFYPNEEFISKNYPNEYIQITNQLTNDLTRDLFQTLMKNKYNMIFHQTLKNNRIADEGILQLKENGYSVVVRALSVSSLESRTSMIERCLGQIEYKGYCRNVTTSDHDRAYEGVPPTLKYIQENGRYDILEVFARGDIPNKPLLIYSHINKDSNLEELSTHPNVSTRDLSFGYDSATEALTQHRQEDAENYLLTAPERLKEIDNSEYLTPTISEQVAELKCMINELQDNR